LKTDQGVKKSYPLMLFFAPFFQADKKAEDRESIRVFTACLTFFTLQPYCLMFTPVEVPWT